MFSAKKTSTTTMLRENLIDENDPEIATVSPTDDIGAELDARLKVNNIEVLNETDDERKQRLAIQEKWDNWVMIGYTCVVATAGEFMCSSLNCSMV
jgi:hypothetical protein